MIDWRPRALVRGARFPEGPVHLGGARFAFTEIRGQCVSLVDDEGYRVVAKTGGGPNGAALGPDGALYVANNGGLTVGPEGYWRAPDAVDGKIQRVTLDGAVDDLIGLHDEPPHRPNDICFGPDGWLYFTDPRNWDDLANLKAGRIWRAQPTTHAAEVVAEVPHFCNGIAFGPDPTKLYIAQSIGMAVIELDLPSGSTREWCRLPVGFPDGICFTSEGDLVVCGSMGDVIQVFGPDGGLRQTIATGEHTEPTNCCIGDGMLVVTMSGSGEVLACDIDADPLPLFPARP